MELISKLETGNSKRSFYGFDGHGSVRFLTDSTGAVTDTYDYDAFGNLTDQTGSTPNNYLFAGEQFDPALGLYYNRARYLDTSTGRFWSMDDNEGSEYDPETLHRYLYSGANPVDRSDPSGYLFEDVTIAQAIQYTLIAINTTSGLMNAYRTVGDVMTAYGAFARRDMWSGIYGVTAAVEHGGLAALSLWSIRGIGSPPPPFAGVVAVGNAGVAAMWQFAATSPEFDRWVLQTLWPVAIGVGGIFYASSQPGHEMDWEHRDSNGRVLESGSEESGGTHPGRSLTWAEQNATHTEIKALEKLADRVRPGDNITFEGTRPPCNPGFGTQGCQIAMRTFAQERSVTIRYAYGSRVWIFRSDGTVQLPLGLQ